MFSDFSFAIYIYTSISNGPQKDMPPYLNLITCMYVFFTPRRQAFSLILNVLVFNGETANINLQFWARPEFVYMRRKHALRIHEAVLERKRKNENVIKQ